ncbi:hypothetical protein OPV22_010532 [Ensete ventricosum]|uniref:HMA domain-containing protein n=1 Tax=Ensete ventricosum TaxID=4639 RepID=A0AAV8RDM2_ENSVE|nr:hypothetical protein OPV22_010532 [Ensete ventricosum]
MAKEDDLKRVELKVSVNCCEGCKRKVLKALSIKGVLRTEIHPTLPKLTVVGNVDVRVLIKKLSKVGKSAEMLSDESQKPQGEGKCCNEASEKKTEKGSKKKKDKEGMIGSPMSNPEKEKNPNSIDGNESKNRGDGDDAGKGQESSKEAGDAGGSDAPDAAKSFNPTIATTIPQVNCMMSPALMTSEARVYYPMEPVAVPMPYYAPAPPPHHVHHHPSYYEMSAYRPPPMESQATVFGDYFNDDNTVGCRIM